MRATFLTDGTRQPWSDERVHESRALNKDAHTQHCKGMFSCFPSSRFVRAEGKTLDLGPTCLLALSTRPMMSLSLLNQPSQYAAISHREPSRYRHIQPHASSRHAQLHPPIHEAPGSPTSSFAATDPFYVSTLSRNPYPCSTTGSVIAPQTAFFGTPPSVRTKP